MQCCLGSLCHALEAQLPPHQVHKCFLSNPNYILDHREEFIKLPQRVLIQQKGTEYMFLNTQ